MRKLSKKIKALILFVCLFIFSFFFIIVNGSTYTIKISNLLNDNSVNDFYVRLEDESVIKIIDKKIENNVFFIKIKSKKEGRSFIEIFNSNSDFSNTFSIYVHKFGIISVNEYFGNCNGGIIIPISVMILLFYILFCLIMSYKKCVKVNMYQYKNIVYLSTIVFVSFSIIRQFFTLFDYNGLISIVTQALNMFSFSMILLPLMFVISILVMLSNVILVKKEGFNVRNILGIVLGIFLCFFTILPEIMYNFFYNSTLVDVHNQNGISLYIYNFFESVIYIVITYVECVLIGTIILCFKSARYIPRFDKDAIIILGCQIQKDGSLTNLLKGRVDRAIEFGRMQKKKTNKDIIFVPSGGKGSDEVITEAEAMKKYLLSCGINKERILVENKSKNTYENIKFSTDIIKSKLNNAKVAFSTTNYHVFRAGCIAFEQGIILEGIGSKTRIYFWVNAFIREFIATLFYERKRHILIVFCIIIIVILMILLMYFNSNV